MMYCKVLLLALIPALLCCTGVQGQTARVVFFRWYRPFNSDVFRHRLKITDAQEGQYARPHTLYGDKYIMVGMLRARSAMVYDYNPPTPFFYIGNDQRDQAVPTDTVQFIRVTNRFYLLRPRYRFRTYTATQFGALYSHKKWLRREMDRRGYRSVEEVLKITKPGPDGYKQ